MVMPYKSVEFPALADLERPAPKEPPPSLASRILLTPIVCVALAGGAGAFVGVAMASAYWTFRFLTQ